MKALLWIPLLVVFCACQPDSTTRQTESAIVASAPSAASEVAAVNPALAAPAPKGAAIKPEAKAAALSDAEARRLAQSNNCFACHTIDKKLVGPAWKDVAAKYRGQPDAEAKLVAQVAKGSSGVWGGSPMPPNAPRVSENDIRALVRFILALK